MTRRDAHGREPPGIAVSHERLREYRRYAALVSAQEAALDEGDLDQVREIAHEISALEARISSMPLEEPPVPREEDAEVAAEILRDALHKTRQLAARLRAMREAEGVEIRHAMARGPQARAYVAQDVEMDPERPLRLDLKS